jgi:hypothetical protein
LLVNEAVIANHHTKIINIGCELSKNKYANFSIMVYFYYFVKNKSIIYVLGCKSKIKKKKKKKKKKTRDEFFFLFDRS